MSKSKVRNRFTKDWTLDVHPGTWITADDDIKIRKELLYTEQGSTKVDTVEEGIKKFQKWLEESDATKVRVQDSNGEEFWIDSIHSYSKAYRARYYYALKALEKWCIQNWDTCYTTLLTLTGSNRAEDRKFVEPVDHLNDLKTTWRKHARKRLHEVIGGARSAWCTVLEPHASGYAHLHIAVFHDQHIGTFEFKRIIRTWVNNCERAGKKAHQVQDESFGEGVLTQRKREPNDDEEVSDYLGDYVGLTFERWEDMDLPHVFFSMTLWATGTRRIRFSNQAGKIIRKAVAEGYQEENMGGAMFLSIDIFDAEGNVVRRIHEPNRGGKIYVSVREYASDDY